MGWCGYDLYAGDGTQTCHYEFIQNAIPALAGNDGQDEIMEFLQYRKTKIPEKYLSAFVKGIPQILKKIKAPRFWEEDSAIEWQMLLSLFIDNKLEVPKIVKDKGLEACEFLLDPASNHCECFDEPWRRRKAIKNFIEKVKLNTKKKEK